MDVPPLALSAHLWNFMETAWLEHYNTIIAVYRSLFNVMLWTRRHAVASPLSILTVEHRPVTDFMPLPVELIMLLLRGNCFIKKYQPSPESVMTVFEMSTGHSAAWFHLLDHVYDHMPHCLHCTHQPTTNRGFPHYENRLSQLII